MRFMQGFVFFLVVATGAGCSTDEDARAKVFSQKGGEAPGDATEGQGPIDLERAARDPGELDKIVNMKHAELSKRLGTHRFSTKAKIRVALGGEVNNLEETGRLVVSPKGSFSVETSNQKGRSRELVFVNGLLAHRVAGGTWTLERGDGFEQKFREDTYRMWAVAYKMFRGHLRLGSPQPAEYEGRSAVRYSIALAEPKGNEPPAEEPPPPPLTATDAEREQSRLKQLVRSRRGNVKRYLAANGHLIVDEETQAPLKFVFDGQYEVQPKSTKPEKASDPSAGARSENPALATRVSTYHIETAVEEIGKPHVVSLPEESKPPPRRRKIDSAPLEGLVDRPEKPSTEAKTGGAAGQ